MIDRKEPSREAIARRAYELYVQRGGECGRDVEDWVRAERELSTTPGLTPVTTKAAQARQTN